MLVGLVACLCSFELLPTELGSRWFVVVVVMGRSPGGGSRWGQVGPVAGGWYG